MSSSVKSSASVRGNCVVGEMSSGQGKSRDEELTTLKRELAKVKQERDFLKDAAVFFAKESK